MDNDIIKRRSRHRSNTTAPVNIPPVSGIENSGSVLPEFVRLPKSGLRCPWTGLSRATLNELILGSEASVRSVELRKRGATRGIRLIHLASLLDFLHGQMEERTVEVVEGKEGGRDE